MVSRWANWYCFVARHQHYIDPSWPLKHWKCATIKCFVLDSIWLFLFFSTFNLEACNRNSWKGSDWTTDSMSSSNQRKGRIQSLNPRKPVTQQQLSKQQSRPTSSQEQVDRMTRYRVNIPTSLANEMGLTRRSVAATEASLRPLQTNNRKPMTSSQKEKLKPIQQVIKNNPVDPVNQLLQTPLATAEPNQQDKRKPNKRPTPYKLVEDKDVPAIIKDFKRKVQYRKKECLGYVSLHWSWACRRLIVLWIGCFWQGVSCAEFSWWKVLGCQGRCQVLHHWQKHQEEAVGRDQHSSKSEAQQYRSVLQRGRGQGQYLLDFGALWEQSEYLKLALHFAC